MSGCGPRPGGSGSRSWGSGSWFRAPGTRRRPRPNSNRCDFDQFNERLARLRRQNPDKDVELWCEDEARLGLKPITCRVWALKGNRPTSNGRHKFESVFVYGFAHPRSGRGLFLALPKANAECMGRALEDFAGWADPAGQKVLVIVDGSGGHMSK